MNWISSVAAEGAFEMQGWINVVRFKEMHRNKQTNRKYFNLSEKMAQKYNINSVESTALGHPTEQLPHY